MRDDIRTILAGIGARGAGSTARANWGNFGRGSTAAAGGIGARPAFVPGRRVAGPANAAPDYSAYYAPIANIPRPAAGIARPAPVAAPVAAPIASNDFGGWGFDPVRGYVKNGVQSTQWDEGLGNFMQRRALYGGVDGGGATAGAVGGVGSDAGGGGGEWRGGLIRGYNRGGAIDGADVHGAAFNSGLVNRPTGGRADSHEIAVPVGSYVVPADVVSALGDGNTMAGAQQLDQLYGSLRTQPAGMARGGIAADRTKRIRISGGEYVVSPEKVAAVGAGDLRKGAMIHDQQVEQIRARNAAKLSRLPGPNR